MDLIDGVLNDKIRNQKKKCETFSIIWKILREAWINRSLAETSPELYIRKLLDIVPEMPHFDTQSGWLLGKRIEKDKELRNMWEVFYATSYEKAQNLQQDLLKRIREKKRPKEMGSRVEMLRALGNAVVPQVVEQIGRAIMKASGHAILS